MCLTNPKFLEIFSSKCAINIFVYLNNALRHKKYDLKVTLTKPSILDGIWAADSESELRFALSREDFKLFAFFDFTELYNFVTEMPKLSLCSMFQRRFNNVQYTRKHNKISKKYGLFK